MFRFEARPVARIDNGRDNMLNDAQITKAAAAIHEAEKRRSQARAVTLEHPDMSLDDAYRIQGAVDDAETGRGP